MTQTDPAAHVSSPATPATLGGLYQHRSRPEWGLATRIADSGEIMSYQFEDGKLRKFVQTHAHLMHEVDRPRDESERLQRELSAKAGLTEARRTHGAAGDVVVTLDAQVRLFLEDFAAGFDDPSYVDTYRGSGKRRAKGHRDPAIAKAAKLLGRSEVLELVSSYRHEEVMTRALEVLGSTSLVDKRQLAVLRALDEDGVTRAVTALSDLLHGQTDEVLAMQAWIDALAVAGEGVSWSLATALPALVHPDKHLCIRESVLGQQARWMAPRLRLTKTPSGRSYTRFRAMALSLLTELRARDLNARDLLDIYDFVWLTLRPAARKRIAAMPPPPVSQPRSNTPSGTDESASDTAAA